MPPVYHPALRFITGVAWPWRWRSRGRSWSPTRTISRTYGVSDSTKCVTPRSRYFCSAPATSPAKPPAQLPLFKTHDGAPGANIEAQFRAFHAVLEGGATRAPIDDIIGTLNLIRQNLVLSATTPSQVARANVTLQELISTVRNSAARLPKPFSDHILAAVRCTADTANDARNCAEQMVKITVDESASGVSVRTDLPNHTFNQHLSYAIDYDITMPEAAPLDLRNRFGIEGAGG